MIIKPITDGMFESICYLVGDNGKAVLIDAGVNSEKVLKEAEKLGLTIEKIILTHGHIDHIVELDNIVNKTNAKVYIHKNDELAITDERHNLSAFTGGATAFKSKYETVEDGSKINVGKLEFKVIHTPGHTSGSICIEVDNTLFSGDTIFNCSYGRVDLPTGNLEVLRSSIMDKLFKLPEEMIVYPGHGESTTIGNEKSTNPIKQAIERNER